VLIIESLESDIRVNISKEAAKGVINLLTPRDQVGISAGDGTLVIPMQHVTNKTAIDHQIDAMDPSDPASYNPDLINAEHVLLHTDAPIKHVILLGDGDAFDDYSAQVLKIAKENITVSAVATNSQSYQELGTMQQIANWGRGRFYRADDPTAIPQVLLKETQEAARRAIINEPFIPAIVGAHPIMTGLRALPELDGYVATTPKPTAQMVLVSHKDDPVLAVWQYGLGRVAAWTSDALGLWTTPWLQWSKAPLWWANLVTWTLPSPDSALNVNGQVVGGTGQLTVDLPPGTSVGAGGQQQVQARIITPSLSQEIVTLQPTAPQRWEGSFPALEVGAYLLQVSWQAVAGNGQGSQLTATTGLVVPYSPEYRTMGTDTRFLTLLAHAGGGALLGPNDTAAAFAQNLPPVFSAVPITFLLLTLAALLLPIDIAARRLSSLDFLVVGFRWLLVQLHLQDDETTQPASAPSSAGTPLSTLRAKRQERRSRAITVTPPMTAKETSSVKSTNKIQTTARETASAQPDVSIVEKLLEAKRKRTQERTEK
jgi:hypothetical protein